MASQVNLDKKRISNVGNKKENDDKFLSGDEDIVSDIIKSMESKIISYKELEVMRERHSICSPNPEVTAPEVKTTKKYLIRKKHPLMEKCQKNLKYLKHNRSVPKQRAHLGEICLPKNIIKKVHPTINSNTSKVLTDKKKAKTISKEVKKCNFSPQNKEGSHLVSKTVDKQAVQVSNDNSESDCNYEEFIRVQKELLESEDTDSEIESASSRHKKKKQKTQKVLESEDTDSEIESASSRHKKKTQIELLESEDPDGEIEIASRRHKKKKRKAQKKLIESEDNDSEIESASSRHKKKKQKVIKCNRKKSKPGVRKKVVVNKLDEKLEESDFEMNESFCFDSDSSEAIVTTPQLDNDSKSSNACSINTNLSLDLTKADIKDFISKNFSCAVRVERNPILDEKMISSLIRETSKNDIDLSSNENHSDSIRLNSDEDECMIICEVPRFNSAFTVNEKSRESLLHKSNFSDTSSNKTISYTDLNFELEGKSSQQSKDSPKTSIHVENLDNSVVKSNDESDIQILSVESLKTHLNSNDYSVDKPNSKEQEQITLNENLSQMVQESCQDSTDCFEKKKFDLILPKKDFFKYAKTYSEPQNLVDNNDQMIHNASKINDFMCDSKINECLNKIDLKLIDSTLKQASCSERFIDNSDNAVMNRNIPLISSSESIKGLDFNYDKNVNKLSTNQISNDPYVKDINPLPSDILEIAQKIDFKEVLSLTKIHSNEITESEIDCITKSLSESTTNAENTFLKNSSYQSVISSNAINSCLLSSNETNNQEKLSLLHRFGLQSVESGNQKLNKDISELTDTFKIKVEKYIESPSDELDVIATANIHDLNEQKSKDFIPLFNLYMKELTKYKTIKSAEQNVSEGLKILEETQFEKLKYLDKAIQSVLRYDPCSLKIIDKSNFSKTGSYLRNNNLSACKQETLKDYGKPSTTEDKISDKQKAEICNNCGLLAKLKCLGCKKVFFCSEKCGLKFWKDGHVSSCQSDSSHVKTEK